MNQDDQNQNQPRQPLIIPKRPIVRETPLTQRMSQSHVSDSDAKTKESATNILRANIDNIYSQDPEATMAPQPAAPAAQAPVAQQPQPTTPRPQPEQQPPETLPTPVVQPTVMPGPPEPVTEPEPIPSPQPTLASQQSTDPYEKTHSKANLKADEEKWREYHSAWQDYYQQYFYRHYAGYMQQKDVELQVEREKHPQAATDPSGVQGSITENQALSSLRSELRAKIRTSTQQARKSRHFIPIAAALSVMLIFAFLQYNTQITGFFASFVSPGNVTPDNIIVDESIDVPVGPEPRLIIPKINVNQPVVWDVTNDEKSQLEAMKSGIAWFGIPGASSKPGQLGNTVLSGHSTNNLLETGDHKFVFLHLPELKKGDTTYVNYKGTRYTYKVTKTEVVKPNQVDKLVYKTDVPVITLITCVPIGTAENRLLVTAEQISPSPVQAKPAPSESDKPEPAKLTGNSPSFLDRLFGS